MRAHVSKRLSKKVRHKRAIFKKINGSFDRMLRHMGLRFSQICLHPLCPQNLSAFAVAEHGIGTLVYFASVRPEWDSVVLLTSAAISTKLGHNTACLEQPRSALHFMYLSCV